MHVRPFLAVTLGAAVLLTGCSSGKDDAKGTTASSTSASPSASPSTSSSAGASASIDPQVAALLEKSRTAYMAAPLVHAVGAATGSGSSLKLDVLNDPKGNGSGTIEVAKGKATLILVGSSLYLKGDDLFWIQNGGAQIGHRLGGKWMQLKATANQYQDMQGFLMREALAELVFSPTGTPTLGTSTDDATWLINDGIGALTIDKATNLPIKLDGKDGSGAFEMNFDYPAQGSIQAPTKDQIAPTQ